MFIYHTVWEVDKELTNMISHCILVLFGALTVTHKYAYCS
jgi:hypothetical protein